jgi:hypothetical protein
LANVMITIWAVWANSLWKNWLISYKPILWVFAVQGLVHFESIFWRKYFKDPNVNSWSSRTLVTVPWTGLKLPGVLPDLPHAAEKDWDRFYDTVLAEIYW